MLLAIIIILAWVGFSIPFGLLMARVLFNGRNDAALRSQAARPATMPSARPIGAN